MDAMWTQTSVWPPLKAVGPTNCLTYTVSNSNSTGVFRNSAQPKNRPVGDLLETVLIYSPWAAIENQDCVMCYLTNPSLIVYPSIVELPVVIRYV